METEKIKLSRLRCNAGNPRTIEKSKFERLTDSILVLPKMLEIRPIVVDNRMVAYGGNMRTKALQAIARMSPETLAERLSTLPDFTEKTQGERDALVAWWGKWLDAPFAYVIRATELSESELREFMIKDNAAFGVWDWDKLANEFDSDRLADWGVDVWLDTPPEQDEKDKDEEDGRPSGEDDGTTGSVTITYPKEREEEVASLLGLSSIEKKRYRLDELA
jgi:hypothetical protein